MQLIFPNAYYAHFCFSFLSFLLTFLPSSSISTLLAHKKMTPASIDPSNATTPSAFTSLPHQDCSSSRSTDPDSITRTTPTPRFPTATATIKIVQQPLHARMCGFGEKDRRPIDPPPIVQLILNEPGYNELKAPPKPIAPVKPRKSKRKGAKRGRKPGKKTLERLAAAAAAAEAAAAQAAAEAEAAAFKSQENEEEEDGEGYEERDGYDEDDENHDGVSQGAQWTGHGGILKDKQPSGSGTPFPPQPRRRGRPSRASLTELQLSGWKQGRDSLDKKEAVEKIIEDETDDSDQEWPRYEGGAEALRQDPLYVLQVSLWSEDGSEVRNMIATPGQTDPPRLTRILMGAVVVSPTLLLNEDNQMGWYFSFPDLSVRTEGVYTLKFSLIQFANFDFDERGGSHASTLIAEETSEPFTVYSAKKFPGMTGTALLFLLVANAKHTHV
ncbi:MAG: velvet factor-domain-containing protein [Linnemannia gamsii]|nr:MAG: velvet factor-domain-containing protein [Linnemannia gamsii]